MTLFWSDQAGIARALLQAYPEQDRLALDQQSLCSLIRALPDFNDTENPPKPAYLDHILWTWMRMADGDSGSGGERQAV